MIKGVLKGGPTDMFLIGLARDNTDKLVAGQPIMITPAQLAELGIKFPMPIVIHFGETEEAILRETRQHGVDLKFVQ